MWAIEVTKKTAIILHTLWTDIAYYTYTYGDIRMVIPDSFTDISGI